MTRVKRGTIAHKRRKNILQYTKGFKWGRKTKFRLAKQALIKAWTYQFRDRKNRKRDFRRLWQIQINAACREHNVSYSKFINNLKKNKIGIDRKILADLGKNHKDIFKKIVLETK